MIVKYTLNDNDFTEVVEKYLDEYGPFYSFNYPNHRGLEEFKNLVRQYDDYNDKYNENKNLSKEEFKKLKMNLLTILKANFIQYISNIKPSSDWCTDGMNAERLQEDKEYILNNITISIVKSIPDQLENGEVIYYITSNQKYITM